MITPNMDPMFHRHLVAAYAVVWIIQVGYLAYAGWKWTKARKSQQSAGKNAPPLP